MKILAYDPYINSDYAAQLGVEVTSLNDLLQRSDFVSLHVPVTEETQGMIGREQFELMKPTAYLINTSRAAVVDEEAMLDALRRKRIAGAGLDVYHREPLPPTDPLTYLDNVVLTPHIGGATQDVVEHQSRMVYEDLTRLLRSDLPMHIFNPDAIPTFLERFRKTEMNGLRGE